MYITIISLSVFTCGVMYTGKDWKWHISLLYTPPLYIVVTLQTLSQSSAVVDEAAALAKKIRERDLMKCKKPSTLKKVGRRIVLFCTTCF